MTESETAKTIKRYPNRKLYDTETSRYVNLEDLAQMLREGMDFEVLDHKSGEDVTGMVLAQILYEEERRDQKHSRIDVLKRVIQAGEESLSQWFGKLKGGLEHPLHGVRDDIESQLKKLVERGQLTADEANRVLKSWFEGTTQNIDQWQSRLDARTVDLFDRVTGIPSTREHTDELIRRLDLMEKRLDVIEDRVRRALRELEA